MPLFLLAIAAILSACTATVTQQVEPLDIVRELVFSDVPDVHLALSESGSTFLGRFSSNSALNSQESFVSDFHGEMRITLYQNNKVECRWWAEGRISDPTVYEGVNGFIEVYSVLCTGKLQRDGSFEFQGSFISEGPEDETGDETFTLKGTASDELIRGSLILDGVLRNAVSLEDPNHIHHQPQGVQFEAVFE